MCSDLELVAAVIAGCVSVLALFECSSPAMQWKQTSLTHVEWLPVSLASQTFPREETS